MAVLSEESLREREYREQVATACRVVATEGWADVTLGHVSVLDRERRLMYIKRKGKALDEIEPSDVLVHNLDDDAQLHKTPSMHFEAVMHTEVYKAREDVGAIIHSHPPYGMALGASDATLQMVNHDAMMFAEHGVATIDDHELITQLDQGKAIAEALGKSRALLLRNHGVLVVGEDIRWAVRAALCLERAIKVQMMASMLGNVRGVDPETAKQFAPRKYTAKKFLDMAPEDQSKDGTSLDEFWEYWERSARRNDGLVPRQI